MLGQHWSCICLSFLGELKREIRTEEPKILFKKRREHRQVLG